MKIRILGCSGAIARHARTTSFLVDSHILVDAGTGVGDLTMEDMAAIDHVVLTHSHLDHVASLPLMIDTVASFRNRPIEVHALPETIAALRQHLFNGVIWPDFSVIPTPENPFVRFLPLQVGDALHVGGHRIEVLPAEHSVPAVGYAIDTPRGQWIYSGDTGRNAAFWRRVNRMSIAMLVIETAFSERERELAERSRHLSPGALADELGQLVYPPGERFPIGIMHTKPSETERIVAEVRGLGLDREHQLHWLEAGEVFEF